MHYVNLDAQPGSALEEEPVWEPLDLQCPWCGEDLMPLLEAMKPCSFDAVYEAHADGCAVMQKEQEGTT